MAQSTPMFTLIESLQSLYKTTAAADLNIKCGNKEFKAHSLIIQHQGGYFSSNMKHECKENSSKVITIEDTDPLVFEAVLQFFYGIDYGVPSELGDACFHAEVYAAADYFDLPKLKGNAAMKFDTCLEKSLPSLAVLKPVYEKTISSDRRLRDVLVRSIHRNAKHYMVHADTSKDNIVERLGAAPELAYDLLCLQAGIQLG